MDKCERKLSVTGIIQQYKVFSKDFWLGYKTLEKLYPDFDSIKINLLKCKRIDPKYYQDIPNYQIERDLLEQEWNQKNEEAKQQGISTHEYIHNLLCTNLQACKNEFYIPTDKYQLKNYDQFLTCQDGIFAEYKLEIPINDEFTLIGIPDCFIIHDGVIDIKDWKTSDTPIKFKSNYEMSQHQTKKLKFPLNGTDDAPGIHYQIQLSIYMWMLLQLRPDLKPGVLEIVWIKDNKIKKVYPVEYMEKQVNKLIKFHVKNIKLQEEMLKCREIKY